MEKKILVNLKYWKKLNSWVAFLMAFPGIVIFVNLGFYFFVALFFKTKSSLGLFELKLKTAIPLWTSLFGLGALLSVINIPNGLQNENFSFALSALPNYLYWVALVLFYINYRSIVDFEIFQKFVFYGVTSYVPFWLIRENYLPEIPIFQQSSQNNLAFLMISYSSIALSFCRKRFGLISSILYLIGILLVMFYLGRRAGFVLVLISGLFTLFIDKVEFSAIIKYLIILISFLGILKLNFVSDIIQSNSPRIYQLIYESDEMANEDRSYLTRVAMVEKGMYLFKENPLTGVGLTNFHRTKGVIEGNFEGAEYVINKRTINELSAHNSYISALSEGGLFLFIPWIMLLITIIIKFILNINRIDSKYYPLFWGFFAMIGHYSSIVGYVNVYSWYIIAMCSVILIRTNDNKLNSKF